jgi:putative Mg2+ transporter-C (MgtC) family protein
MISLPTFLLRLCLALLLGACIGVERQSHAQSAGLRTNTLVALGTCLFTIISAYGFDLFLTIPRMQVDPSRVASYVVAGIGFLGAGAIFRSQESERAKGLTTAATIWVVAAIGLACGIGMLLEAVATTVLALTVLVGLRTVERFFWGGKGSAVRHISLEATAVTGQLIGEVYQICTRNGLTIGQVRIHTGKEGAAIQVACLVQDPTTLARTLGELQTLAGIQGVHADLPTRSRAKDLAAPLDEEASQ